MEPDETADDGGAQLRAGLAAALKDALRARDTTASSALRTTLSAIANAEAVASAPPAPAPAGRPHFAGALAGLGAGEVARRQLSASDVTAIVRAEIAECEAAAAGYLTNGLPSQAERLRTQARILTSVVAAVAKDKRSGQKNGRG